MQSIPVHGFYIAERAKKCFKAIADATGGTCARLDIHSSHGADLLTDMVTVNPNFHHLAKSILLTDLVTIIIPTLMYYAHPHPLSNTQWAGGDPARCGGDGGRWGGQGRSAGSGVPCQILQILFWRPLTDT